VVAWQLLHRSGTPSRVAVVVVVVAWQLLHRSGAMVIAVVAWQVLHGSGTLSRVAMVVMVVVVVAWQLLHGSGTPSRTAMVVVAVAGQLLHGSGTLSRVAVVIVVVAWQLLHRSRAMVVVVVAWQLLYRSGTPPWVVMAVVLVAYGTLPRVAVVMASTGCHPTNCLTNRVVIHMVACIATCTNRSFIHGASCPRGGTPVWACASIHLARALFPKQAGPSAEGPGAVASLDVALRDTMGPRKVGDRHASCVFIAESLAIAQGSIAYKPSTWAAHFVWVFLVAAHSLACHPWLWCRSRRLCTTIAHLTAIGFITPLR